MCFLAVHNCYHSPAGTPSTHSCFKGMYVSLRIANETLIQILPWVRIWISTLISCKKVWAPFVENIGGEHSLGSCPKRIWGQINIYFEIFFWNKGRAVRGSERGIYREEQRENNSETEVGRSREREREARHKWHGTSSIGWPIVFSFERLFSLQRVRKINPMQDESWEGVNWSTLIMGIHR